MDSAVIAAVFGTGGAVVGSYTSYLIARRQLKSTETLSASSARQEARQQLRSLALEMAREEMARNPDASRSLPEYWVVIERALAELDETSGRTHRRTVDDARRHVARMMCANCGAHTIDGTCMYCARAGDA